MPARKRYVAAWAVLAMLMLVGAGAARAASDQPPSEPNFLHGLGQASIGAALELPKTIVDATLSGPPVAGTLVGVIAAPIKAAQVMYRGLQEMALGFDPWGAKE